MSAQFTVLAPRKAAWVTLLVLCGLVPLTALALVLAFSDEMRTAGLVPQHAIAVGVTLAALVFLLTALRRMRVGIEEGVLVVRATLYARKLPLERIDIERAHILELDRSSEYWPRIRLNGIGLPGLRIGYFRGAPFKRKLFCLMTSNSRVLLLPEHEPERFLLLSLERPQTLIDAIKQRRR